MKRFNKKKKPKKKKKIVFNEMTQFLYDILLLFVFLAHHMVITMGFYTLPYHMDHMVSFMIEDSLRNK